MIVATIRTAGGVTVRVHDDCMAAPGSEAERRAVENQRRAAHEILMEYARREGGKGDAGFDS